MLEITVLDAVMLVWAGALFGMLAASLMHIARDCDR